MVRRIEVGSYDPERIRDALRDGAGNIVKQIKRITFVVCSAMLLCQLFWPEESHPLTGRIDSCRDNSPSYLALGCFIFAYLQMYISPNRGERV